VEHLRINIGVLREFTQLLLQAQKSREPGNNKPSPGSETTYDEHI
jgi:hypothetical protein